MVHERPLLYRPYRPAAMSPRDQALAVLKDKFRGAMVGAVLGDALGAPLEFKWVIQY